MNDLSLAAIQMNSGDDVRVNCRVAGELLERSAAAGATLAVLPENFSGLSGDSTLRVRMAEADGHGPVQDSIAELADRLSLWIVAGTLPIRGEDPARPYASCCVYDDSGERVARYDKIHLFDVDIPGHEENYRESVNTVAGHRPGLLQTPWGRLGLAVCYDLRFPELFRYLCSEGMEILALPSAFTRPTGLAHWEVLIRARAIENLCYVVAAAQTGRHPGGRQTFGHSMICDPWGEVLDEIKEGVGFIIASGDNDRLQQIRQRFPAHTHGRLGISAPTKQTKGPLN
jgi:predicted amidohydrolase